MNSFSCCFSVVFSAKVRRKLNIIILEIQACYSIDGLFMYAPIETEKYGLKMIFMLYDVTQVLLHLLFKL